MVMPGMRTDPRTPGGMPDSGTVNPGGPMPSMPKMGPGPGPTVPGVPDPKKIEEIFTQYTSGQITREDLINQLHTFSEGQGGILGLLESMGQESTEGAVNAVNGQGMPTMPGMQLNGMQPNGIQPPAGGALPVSPQGPGVGGDPMISPGAASVPIPPLEEPLDARHQQISQLLQRYGLGPADADQMASILNPQHEYWREETEGEEAAQVDPSAGGTIQTGVVDEWTQTKESLAREAERKRLRELELKRLREAEGTQPPIDLDLEGGAFGPEATDTPQEPWKPTYVPSDPRRDVTVTSAADLEAERKAAFPDLDVGGAEDILPQGISDADRERIAREAEVERQRQEKERQEEEDRRKLEQAGAGADLGLMQLPQDFENTATGQFVKSGGAYSSFYGGNWEMPDEEGTGLWNFVLRAWQKGGGPGGMDAPGFAELERLKLLPVQDPATGDWFPNSQVLGKYKEWSKPATAENPDVPGSYWGGGTAEFSHWADPTTNKRVKYGTPGAVAVAKNSVAILAKIYNKNTGFVESRTYHFAADNEYLAGIREAIEVSGWLPWDEQGNKWTGNEGYLPGHEPGGFFGTPAVKPANKNIPKADVPKVGDALPSPMELPEGAVVDTEDGGITLDGVYIGQKDLDGKITLTDDYMTGVGMGEDGADPRDQTGVYAPVDISAGRLLPKEMENFVKSLTSEISSPHADATVAQQIIKTIGDLQSMKMKGDQETYQRMADLTMNELDRAAVTARATADRALQMGAAAGFVSQWVDLQGRPVEAGTPNARRTEDLETLASRAEENRRVFEMAQISGTVPQFIDGNWVSAAPGEEPVPGLARQELEQEKELTTRGMDITEADKMANNQLNLIKVFGQFVDMIPKVDTVSGVTTWIPSAPTDTQTIEMKLANIEKDKFGLTKAIAAAELTGIFKAPGTGGVAGLGVMTPETQKQLISTMGQADQSWLNYFFVEGNTGNLSASGLRARLSDQGKAVADQIQSGIDAPAGGPADTAATQTLAAMRMGWERDIANRAADTQDRLAANAEQMTVNSLSIASNRNVVEAAIAGGKLQEAVNARKDATYLENERIILERDRMKLDTLMSLANPATFLFATRYGILDDIGIALGVDFGDDIIASSQIPSMVTPGTMPSLTDFADATPSHRAIMLAEMASSGGFSTDQAVQMIMESAPGGDPRFFRRPAVLGAAR